MDKRAGDRRRAAAVGSLHQNQEEGDGGAAHQTSRSMPPVRGQPGHTPRLTTRACPSRHHGQHSNRGRGMPLRRRRAGGRKTW